MKGALKIADFCVQSENSQESGFLHWNQYLAFQIKYAQVLYSYRIIKGST